MTGPSRPFETERTRRFRQANLGEQDARTVDNVEIFGCQLVSVKQSRTAPGFSYTIGIFDTCGKPEVITVGLPHETAGFLLNEAARRLRDGIDLAHGRHRDMVGGVECEFHPVDPRWVQHLMLWATWYYDGVNFPVLQAVYPDLDNRFPEEQRFDDDFRQPLLQADVAQTGLEEDFWASTDSESSLFDWKFPDPPHTRVFLSKAVHTGSEPITYVSHDIEDGAWQLLGDSMTGGEEPVISCFHHPIDKDPSLSELADLPLGWWAERSAPGEPWIRHKDEPDEED